MQTDPTARHSPIGSFQRRCYVVNAPAATGQLLTVRFGTLVALAVTIGIGSSVVGLYVSYWLDVASGATIVLVQTALFLIALAFGPRTGLLSRPRPGDSAPITAS